MPHEAKESSVVTRVSSVGELNGKTFRFLYPLCSLLFNIVGYINNSSLNGIIVRNRLDNIDFCFRAALRTPDVPSDIQGARLY